MSKGTKIIALRLDDETQDLIKEECAKSRQTSKDVPYSVSSWIRHAIQEKLNKLRRGRQDETVMRKPIAGDDGRKVSEELESEGES